MIRHSPSANVTIPSFAPSPPCCYKAALPDDPPPGHWRAVNATSTDGGNNVGSGNFSCVEPDSFVIKGEVEWMGDVVNPETHSPMSPMSQPAGSGLATSSSSLPLSTPADSGMARVDYLINGNKIE